MSVVPLGDEQVSTGLLTVGEDGTVVVPAEVLRAAGLCPGDSVGFAIREDGQVVIAERDPDQAWFWTEEWLTGTHEAKLAIREGKGTVYLSDEEFLAELERLDKLA